MVQTSSFPETELRELNGWLFRKQNATGCDRKEEVFWSKEIHEAQS